MQRSPEEIQEIERHKYYLSEQRGYDVGWEFAEQDWEDHHADRWRAQQGHGVGHSQHEALATATVAAPAGYLRQDTLTSVSGEGPRWRSLLARWLGRQE